MEDLIVVIEESLPSIVISVVDADTNIKIPKNPIDTIFLQPFGKVIDPRFARILGNCLPAKKGYSCKIVAPKKNQLILINIFII